MANGPGMKKEYFLKRYSPAHQLITASDNELKLHHTRKC